ncbi:MAG: helix-turn-helix transcriptional regulator [Opitutaceae bacterium]|nr:helix-turn-helix transcriptional regulator [Opitutaceae bacterium]
MRKPDLRDILAGNIRLYRTKAGLSQDEFADKCGLHRTYVGSIERCERNVTLGTLELLAKATGAAVPTLLTAGGIR